MPRPVPKDFGLAATPFAEIAQVGMQLATFVSMLAAYLIAASAIGAEYTSGSLANWLSFVPSRGKVYASKLAAVVLVAGVGSAIIVGLMFAVTALITSLYGGGLEGGGDVAATGVRGLVLAVLAAVFGFAFALLTRHTGAALGLVLGYLVISVVIGFAAIAVPALGFLPPWLPEYNLTAFLEHGTSYYRTIEETTASGVEYRPVEERISFARSAGYWAVLAAVAVAVSTAVFRRRDIT
jgi:ABC-2 type transport system permease protein